MRTSSRAGARPGHRPRYARSYAALYQAHVGQAPDGCCDFDFLVAAGAVPEPMIF